MCYILSPVREGHILARSLPLSLTRPCLSVPPQWLLSPCFRSRTHHETRVFTTGSLNSTPLPSPNSRTIIFAATTPRPCASRNSSPTILISSLARLYLPSGMQTVTVIHSMTLLYCPRLSRCSVTRRQTRHHPNLELTALTSKTRLITLMALSVK